MDRTWLLCKNLLVKLRRAIVKISVCAGLKRALFGQRATLYSIYALSAQNPLISAAVMICNYVKIQIIMQAK